MDRDGQTPEGNTRMVNASVDAVVTHASGLPLYVHFVVEDLLAKRLSFAELPTQLPPSLNDYFDRLLERLSIGDMAVLTTRLTATIMWAELPLQEETLLQQQRAGVLTTDEETPQILKQALSLLRSVIQPRSLPDGKIGWEPYHQSFREYVWQVSTFRNENARARQGFCVATWSATGRQFWRNIQLETTPYASE